jgi:hypothetical protein
LVNGGHLFWITSDLVRDHSFRLEDCFSVNRSQRITKPPLMVSFAHDIREIGGEKASYTEIVKRSLMAEWGQWIWQADKPRGPSTGSNLKVRGTGAPQPRPSFRPQAPPPTNLRPPPPVAEFRAPHPHGDQM